MASWVKLDVGVSDADIKFAYAFISGDGSTLLTAVGSDPDFQDIYISTDGGDTWSLKSPDQTSWSHAALSSNGQYIAVCTNSDVLWISDDSGDTWSEVTTAGVVGNYLAMASDGSVIYLAGTTANGIHKSTDYGATWSTDTTYPAVDFIYCDADGSVVLIAIDDTSELYYSTNGGSSWSLSRNEWSTYSALNSTGANMITSSGIVSGLLASTDSGATWAKIIDDAQIYVNDFISSDGSIIFCSSLLENNKTVFSYDSGVTWGSDEIGAPVFFGATSTGGILLGQSSSTNALYLYTGILPSTSFFITSIAPSTGSTAGGTPVTIVGEGFDPAATAAIDGNDLTDITVVDSTTITGITPAGTVGAKDVTVTNP